MAGLDGLLLPLLRDKGPPLLPELNTLIPKLEPGAPDIPLEVYEGLLGAELYP